MPKGLFQRLLPHLIAVVIFIIVAVIYCKPVLEGKVVTQHDITQWQGAFHQSEVYKETHGNYPLWTNALFSGMPTFQIGGTAQNYVAAYANLILTLGLPKPISYFFLACICFYILSIILGIRSYIGILGSLAFAYATYNPVIISVGHDTKMLSIAYMPAVIGAFLLIFERKYWLGAALAALFTSCIIAMNHLQITYYTFLIVGVMAIFYAVRWVRSKEFLSMGKVAGFAIVALALGVLTNAVNLFSTYEYQKETIRGGGSELAGGAQAGDAKNGLDKSYALSYSMNIAEPFVLMVPRFYGGSSDKLEVNEEDSKAIEALRNMPQELAQQLQGNITFYWGGMTKVGEVGTSGPPYSGAIICFLAILSMFVLDGKHKWWALTAIVLAVFMSWGHYFEGFNGLLYKYLPFYNKFRAPSMIMVIPQVLLPMLAVLCVHRIATTENKVSLLPAFKKGLIATGAVFFVLFLLYFSFDFLSGSNKEILKQVRAMNQPQMTDMVQTFFNALAEDRKNLMMADILRSFGFILVAAALVFFAIRNVLQPLVLSVLLTVAAFIDVMAINVKYLNSDNYKEQEENTLAFQKTQADEQLLADKSFYRVFSVSSPFTDNTTSYYYNSIAGYHPAKLRIYQDLIEQQLQKQPMNEKVLDMLNTKYFIQKDQNGQTQAFQQRPTALGNAWFVKAVRFVPTAEAEMRALDNLNAKDTAVIREEYRSQVGAFQFDSSATIQLVKNDNDIITYKYNAPSNQLAVFSEIFYDKGWKAFVDGKETPIVKANYVLRAMMLPAGAHNIEFRFEPQAYLTGKTIALIATIALVLLVAAAIYLVWKRNRQA